ncbi:hypothetical protein [Caulobacter mirabilis]|uniref:Uncharacterized protein n=1 Tax=Caulobacter mirabilis TaxID=69666 RepID=A0A2D2AV66_9CAUL|nr:hypothetical protein [Caulobacter mirabilis]ATQ41886.1 hypothetical protein CSW64_05390 [Caulobacter mirabilis]
MLTAVLFALALASKAQTPGVKPATPSGQPATRSAFVQGTLNLAIGERATLRRQPDGSYVLDHVERISVEDVAPPANGGRAETLNGTSPGTVRLALNARRDVGSILKVENGTGEALQYNAFIVRIAGGKPQPPAKTSVCTIPAGLVSYEHWPEPVIQVVAGGLKATPEKTPACG